MSVVIFIDLCVSVYVVVWTPGDMVGPISLGLFKMNTVKGGGGDDDGW